MITDFVVAFGLSVLIAAIAFWRRALDRSGALAAVGVGLAVLGLGGWAWGWLLFWFFCSSSLLSRYRERDKAQSAATFAKGGRRDWGQVLANGGAAATAAVLGWIFPDPLWFVFFAGALATATADTWATELGTLSRGQPRLITTGKKVASGTSGGLSALGTGAALVGGLSIGLVALASGAASPGMVLLAGAAGLAGALVDSLLGATVQGMYICLVCDRQIERQYHCNQRAQKWRGWSWMGNDQVNFLASLLGGAVAVGLWSWAI